MGRQLVIFPVVVAGIHHPIFGAAGQIAAGAGGGPAIIMGAQLYAAAVRVQQHFFAVKAGAAVGTPGPLDAVGVTLADRNALYMDVPVVGGAVESG